jgi:hypothetical protein
MLTHAHVFVGLPSRAAKAYAHVCSRMLTHAHACSRMLTYAGDFVRLPSRAAKGSKVLSLLALLVQNYKYLHLRSCCRLGWFEYDTFDVEDYEYW